MADKSIKRRDDDEGEDLGWGILGAINKVLDGAGVPKGSELAGEQDAKHFSAAAERLCKALEADVRAHPTDYLGALARHRAELVKALADAYNRGAATRDGGVTDEE